MDDGDLLGLLDTGSPVGLGGCRNDGDPFAACEYNVTVFDGSGRSDETLFEDDAALRISYGSLTDLSSDTLIHYDRMRILQDPGWELRMLLSRIRERRAAIFRDHAKNCLINSIFCAAKAGDGIGSDVYAPCWAKSALVCLAYSILALHMQRPTPAHCLSRLRNLEKDAISEKAGIINDCLGMERATPSLLARMSKSAMGFSDVAERNGHSRIIGAKTGHFIENSMLADCYMYLTCINHANLVRLKDTLNRNPDLIHILRVAFDLENDPEKMRQDLEAVRRTSDAMLQSLR